MDRDEALRELPGVYAVALRMADGGSSHGDIAGALGVPVEAVATLLEVARIKLADLMGEGDTPP
jgi:DNA-directed RNA polymerase specialized sigma24 family protein